MKIVSLCLSAVGLACSQEVLNDEFSVSLLQHNMRSIRKVDEVMDDPPGPPPPGVADRIAARREQRRAERAAGRTPSDLPAAVVERRRARRMAKKQAKRQAHAGGQAHFNDGGSCDTCAAHCTATFNEEFKDCMIRENCRPWLKEDGMTKKDKCAKRCDRSANWKREPCIRGCECDVDLIGRGAKLTENVVWADGHHRCQNIPLGSMSSCTSVAEDANSPKYDSIKKCGKAAVEAGADTFNFYRTSKEYGKCSLRQCGSGDLQVTRAPPSAEAPAGRGNWKVFSTFCQSPPPAERSDTGLDDSSR